MEIEKPGAGVRNTIVSISHSIVLVFHSLIKLIFPRLCGVCGNALVRGEKFLCSACLADFPFSDDTFISGAQVLAAFDERCRPERLYSLFYYNKYDNYRRLVYAIKYHSRRELGIYLGGMLGQRMLGQTDADCIVPIPLHRKREKSRGFNQSYQIALGVSEVLGIEVLNDVVVRTQNNISQTGKNVEERRKNVENIFELLDPEKIRGRHVLLIDDVITTGATIRSCLSVLARAGEVRFSLACLARTTG